MNFEKRLILDVVFAHLPARPGRLRSTATSGTPGSGESACAPSAAPGRPPRPLSAPAGTARTAASAGCTTPTPTVSAGGCASLPISWCKAASSTPAVQGVLTSLCRCAIQKQHTEGFTSWVCRVAICSWVIVVGGKVCLSGICQVTRQRPARAADPMGGMEAHMHWFLEGHTWPEITLSRPFLHVGG